MNHIYRLAWKEYGDPTLPTIVLLMGLGMPSAAWPESLIQLLVRKGLHVIAPDNRDCGNSEHCEEKVSTWTLSKSIALYLLGGSVRAPYVMDDMASDVEALLDTLRLDRVHVAGFSLGGMIAQALAVRAPHRVISLTCISSASGNPRTGLGKIGAVRAVLKNCTTGKDSAVRYSCLEALLKKIGSPNVRYSRVELARYLQIFNEANISEDSVRRQLMAILAGGNRCRQLRQLVTPTLVVHGDADPLLPLRAGEEIAQCVENAKLLVVHGMGHDLPEVFHGRIGEAVAQHCYSGVLR